MNFNYFLTLLLFIRSAIIEDLVNKTVLAGWDGLIIDYEPNENSTIEHAQLTALVTNVKNLTLSYQPF